MKFLGVSRWIYVNIFIILTISACQNNEQGLESALRIAGSNEMELQNVLVHYKDSRDSLKRKAAIFLIENMLYKNSYKNSLYNDKIQFFNAVKTNFNDSTLTKLERDERFRSLYKRNQLDYEISFLKEEQNLKTIKADYLIENIDLAFEAWETFPWARDVSFEDFCNYILPYRVFNEPLSNWRRKLIKRYNWVLDSIKNPNSLREATLLINKFFNKAMHYYSDLRPIPNALGFNELDSLKLGKCDHLVIMNIYALRAMGIPASAEGAIWANHRSGHSWCAVIERGKPLFAFDPLYPPSVSDSIYLTSNFNYIPEDSISKVKAAKIHRTIYKNNYSSISSISDSEDIRGILESSVTVGINLLDVTSEYKISQSKLNLELTSRESKDILFLSIFNRDRWKKLVFTEKDKKGIYAFNSLGTEIVYKPQFLHDTISIPPFILKKDGSVSFP